MRKILLITILLSVASISDDSVKIEEFDFCSIEKVENKREEGIPNRRIVTIEKRHLSKRFYTRTDFSKTEYEKLSDQVAFSYGSGRQNYFVFADPQCKFCRAFAKGSLSQLDKATYHVILMPLPKHKDAKKMISFILDGKTNSNRIERFFKTLVEERLVTSSILGPNKDDQQYMAGVDNVVKEFEVKSTPTFFKISTEKLKKLRMNEFYKDR